MTGSVIRGFFMRPMMSARRAAALASSLVRGNSSPTRS